MKEIQRFIVCVYPTRKFVMNLLATEMSAMKAISNESLDKVYELNLNIFIIYSA